MISRIRVDELLRAVESEEDFSFDSGELEELLSIVHEHLEIKECCLPISDCFYSSVLQNATM